MTTQTLKQKPIWSDAERRAWELPQGLSVSAWADENRYLDQLTSAEPGSWNSDRTPYLRGIMDAFYDPDVEEITIMASTQVGKTEAMLNMLGYAIDQDPSPTLWVMPRETDCRGISTDRIRPMIELSPALRAHINPDLDDLTKMEMRLDRMIIYLAGANSPAGLSQKPIRNLFMDECDKYPKFSGKEADPIKLATERTRTFWNRKIVKCSTPTTRAGYIFREYERSDKHRYYVPCPHCGKYQVLIFAQIQLPDGERDPDKIKDNNLAWYECVECRAKIDNREKQRMVSLGIWAPEGSTISKDGIATGGPAAGRKRGFWINAIYSPWITFSEIAAEFLRSKDNIELLMNFVNSWLAEIWEEKAEETKEEKIHARVMDYPEGVVPAGGIVLTGGVDLQKDHFYGTIRAWGVGQESWLVRAFRSETWEDVINAFLLTNYKRQDGVILPVRLTCFDSGFRTDEVYEVCRKYRDIARAVKGQTRLTGVPFRISRIERNPKTGSVIEGGITLWLLDTSLFKDKITRMINAAPGDPAQWHIHAGISDEYVRQMCSEHKVLIRDRKKGKTFEEWRPKASGGANHYWDAEVYAAAAAEMIGVTYLRHEDDATVVYKPRTPSGYEIKRGDAWLGGRKGWLR